MEVQVPISLVIADDHPIMLIGLTALFEAESDFSVLDTVSNGEEKWERNANSALPNLEGAWRYQMQAKDLQDWECSGVCSIAQVGCSLIFKGERAAMNGPKLRRRSVVAKPLRQHYLAAR